MMRSTKRSKGMGGHHKPRAGTVVWLTPPHILDALGGSRSFDLDPCSPAHRPWDTARHHYTKADDGLVCPWFGRVWLNPPYTSSEIGKWMGRMAAHGVGTALIFARTETEAFHKWVWEAADSVLFLYGRLHFCLPDGSRAPHNGGAPSVLCGYGRVDTDILAASDLPGSFIPLRLPVTIFGCDELGEGCGDHGTAGDPDTAPSTWVEAIRQVMTEAKEALPVAELYRALAGSAKATGNPHWREKIRQTLQRGPFTAVERGVWRLNDGTASLP